MRISSPGLSHGVNRRRFLQLSAALGIPPDHTYVVEKRPFFVTKDGKGKPVRDLFA